MIEEPPRIESLVEDIPTELAALIRRMMAKDPAQRFATPAEAMVLLQAILDQLKPTGSLPRRRNKLVPMLVMSTAFCLAILAVVLIFGSRKDVSVTEGPGKENDVSVAKRPGEELAVFGPAEGPPVGIPWSDDPQTLVRSFIGHEGQVNGLALAPDARELVTAGWDGTVRVWDVETGNELRRWRAARQQVWGLALSPNGRFVVTSGSGAPQQEHLGAVGEFDPRIWRVHDGSLVGSLPAGKERIVSLAMAHSGKVVYGCGDEEVVRAWSLPHGTILWQQRLYPGFTCTTLTIFPDDRILAVASRDISFLDAATGKVLRRGVGHQLPILKLAFSPDGQHLVSGSVDRTIRLWDSATGLEIQRWPVQRTGVSTLAYSPKGREIAVANGLFFSQPRWYPAGFDNGWRIWSVECCGISRCDGLGETVTAMAFTPDGQHLLTGSVEGSVCLWRLTNAPASASPTNSGDFDQVIHLTKEQMEKWIDGLRPRRMRPIFIYAYEHGGKVLYSGTAVANLDGLRWLVQLSIPKSVYDFKFRSISDRGFGPTWVMEHRADAREGRLIAIWEAGRGYWASWQLVNRDVFFEYIKKMKAENLVPVLIMPYQTEPEQKTSSVFTTSGGRAHVWAVDISAGEFQEFSKKYPADQYRLISLAIYPVNNELRYAAVWRQDADCVPWIYRLDMTYSEFTEAMTKEKARGYRLDRLTTYPRNGEIRFGAVWVRARPYDPDLRRAGTVPAELKPIDDAMIKFMSERDITAGAVAVIKNGRVVMSAGYGNRDSAGLHPTQADTPFRIASLTKPITAAFVRKLIADGKLSEDAPVLPLLKIEPLPGSVVDPRWNKITVRHLLKHQGGWDCNASFDPMFRSLDILKAVGKPGPPTPQDVVRYMLGKPLQFEPGTKSVYSNFGYCLLGRVIETVTGKTYIEAVRSEMLIPMGLTQIDLGRTLPDQRLLEEPEYQDEAQGRSVFAEHKERLVPFPDGAFCLEHMDAHGGLIAPMDQLAKFFAAYMVDGTAARPGTREVLFGSMPGTYSMMLRLPDEVVITAAFNRRCDSSGREYSLIAPMMEDAVKKIARWPSP
ncbi:MAG: serine hydrolase [Gemmatales bacterium]|nr:serine hydrolase [Gemmatales bacterium]MDW7995349.1 serine hydrolase [Gemmatales bacterium]